MKQKKKSIWLAPVMVTLATLLLLKSVFLIGYVPTASMEPAIKQGSYIIGLRVYGELNQGDIIIFRHEGKMLVKRIAAVGGESVRWGEATLCVPEGEFYVLGDNADNSNDSRYWEDPFVPKEHVEGKIFSVCKKIQLELAEAGLYVLSYSQRIDDLLLGLVQPALPCCRSSFF